MLRWLGEAVVTVWGTALLVSFLAGVALLTLGFLCRALGLRGVSGWLDQALEWPGRVLFWALMAGLIGFPVIWLLYEVAKLVVGILDPIVGPGSGSSD